MRPSDHILLDVNGRTDTKENRMLRRRGALVCFGCHKVIGKYPHESFRTGRIYCCEACCVKQEVDEL